MLFSVLSAFGIEYLSKKTEIREDSVIAMLWSLGMALGIIFIFLTPGYSANLMSYLFGNILTVSKLNIYLLGALCLVLIGIFYFMFKTILFVAFDEDFARAMKLPVAFTNYLLITLVALTIVLNIRVVGIILVISLLTIPQTIAGIYSKDFKKIIWLSIIIGFVGSFFGLIISYYFNIPSGATIIFFMVVLFILAKLINSLLVSISIKKQLN
jgi:zinc transport system permease protein